MTNLLKWTLLIVSIFIFTDCSQEFEFEDEVNKASISGKFSAHQARAYFEGTAEDLRMFTMTDNHAAYTKRRTQPQQHGWAHHDPALEKNSANT